MFLLFFIIWVAFNGRLTAEIAVFGIVIAAVMYLFICKFMNYSFRKDIWFFRNIVYILEYLIVLILEILKANLSVISLVISSQYEPEPEIVTFTTDLKHDLLKVVLANTITLTPGTITASLEGNTYTVHCLDKEFAKGIEDSVFVKLLRNMEEAS